MYEIYIYEKNIWKFSHLPNIRKIEKEKMRMRKKNTQQKLK